jgi:hypothetical protein
VPVNVAGNRNAAVSEQIGNRLDMNPSRRAKMAEIRLSMGRDPL